VKLIHEGTPSKLTLLHIIETYSTWTEIEGFREFPIFEARCSQSFPMEETLIPIMKRKIMAYVFQVVNYEKINNFDSEE
jgi:hypothetical protein